MKCPRSASARAKFNLLRQLLCGSNLKCKHASRSHCTKYSIMACENTNCAFVCRLGGTVIRKIWLRVLLLAVFTTGLVCADYFVDEIKMEFPQTLIPVLGFVTGLLLVFRTNAAYDRYWEGRKLWSQITHNIRTLTRYVWATVEEKEVEDLIEKLSIINLLVAFPFAMKNYLRENYSYEAKDLRDLIAHLPRVVPSKFDCPRPSNAAASSGSNSAVSKQLDLELQVASSISGSQLNLRTSKRDKWRAHAEPTDTNIPIEILLYFASYLNKLATKEQPLPPPFLSAMNLSLSSLSDAVSGLERILQTPIPLAYAVHLEHLVWLYLLALPFQLIGILHWWTIPAVTLASFSLLGILDIGGEIENPFGNDFNDLPLEQICDRIKREAYLTVGRPLGNPATWIFTAKNHPLLPMSQHSAMDLTRKNLDELHRLLAKRAKAFSKVKDE